MFDIKEHVRKMIKEKLLDGHSPAYTESFMYAKFGGQLGIDFIHQTVVKQNKILATKKKV